MNNENIDSLEFEKTNNITNENENNEIKEDNKTNEFNIEDFSNENSHVPNEIPENIYNTMNINEKPIDNNLNNNEEINEKLLNNEEEMDDNEQHELLRRRLVQKEIEEEEKKRKEEEEKENLKNNQQKNKPVKLGLFKELLNIWFTRKNKFGFGNNLQEEEDIEDINDDRICKLCFCGPEEKELGKLISPCKCKGTMKYIHVNCLNEWRLASKNKSSFVKCDQCGYEYNIQRALIGKILANKLTVILLSLIVFYLLLFFSGFLVKFVLYTNIGILKNIKKIALFDVGLIHHSYGLFVCGIFGLSKLVFSIGIIDLNYYFRPVRSNRNEDKTYIYVILIIIGCIKVLWDTYKVVNEKCKRSLLLIGDRIMEVQDDEK